MIIPTLTSIDTEVLVGFNGRVKGGLSTSSVVQLRGQPEAGATTLALSLLWGLYQQPGEHGFIWIDGDSMFRDTPFLAFPTEKLQGAVLQPDWQDPLGSTLWYLSRAGRESHLVVIDRVDPIAGNDGDMLTLLKACAETAYEHDVLVVLVSAE